MSEEFDDYDYEDDYDDKKPKEEKEVIEGYTVQTSVSIGSKRIIYAKDETEKMEMPYMKCIAVPNSLFTRYENAVISDSFEDIIKLFADDIKAEAIIIETENRARRASELPAFTASELIKVTDEQVAAMENGIIFGWDTIVSDPRNYDENGHFYVPENETKGRR